MQRMCSFRFNFLPNCVVLLWILYYWPYHDNFWFWHLVIIVHFIFPLTQQTRYITDMRSSFPWPWVVKCYLCTELNCAIFLYTLPIYCKEVLCLWLLWVIVNHWCADEPTWTWGIRLHISRVCLENNGKLDLAETKYPKDLWSVDSMM